MEILVLIGIYMLFKFFITNASSSSNYNSNVSNRTSEPALKLTVDLIDEIIEGKTVKFFRFKIKGILKNKTKRIRIIIGAFDVTEGRQNVFNTFSDLQLPDSDYFCYMTEWINMNFDNAYFPEEVVLTELPVESFVFPKKGRRSIEFIVEIEDSVFDVVNTSRYQLDYYNNEMGYVDFRDDLIIAENAIVKMALMVAGSDQTFQQVEVDVIKAFVNDLSDDGGQPSAPRLKELNDIIRNTIINHKNLNFKNEIASLSTVIKDKANNRLKHMAIEFFLKLVSVDGKYSKEEQELIELISKNIDYDADRIRALKDKIISVSIHDDLTDTTSLLGINESMSDEEKKKHLREEYKKWNQRVTHSDPNIREQASQMLELISQERAKL